MHTMVHACASIEKKRLLFLSPKKWKASINKQHRKITPWMFP